MGAALARGGCVSGLEASTPDEALERIIGLLDRPIDWDAFDDLPVDTVFLLLASSGDQHLELLSRLARAISDPTLRQLLRKRGSLPAVLKRVRELESEMTARRAPR